jgi:exosortase/archaeosortase family protein
MKKRFSIKDLYMRYAILVLIGLPGLGLFYFIFFPLTVYPVYFLLGLFYEITLVGSSIFTTNLRIDIIGPCIAGSAYSLLLILNLATPNIKINKRLKMIAISFLILLFLNIMRIFLLSILAMKNLVYFNLVHMLFWYVLSIVFVVAIWFFLVKRFKVKEIPFYSDLKTLHRLTKR